MNFREILKYDTNPQKMSTARAFLISLLYMISADGQIDSKEVAHLLAVTGSTKTGPLSIQVINQKAVDLALAYRSKHSLESFLTEATPMLSHLQRKCILLNLFDCATHDQHLQLAEKEVFDKFLQAFQISGEELSHLLDAILLKNNLTIFEEHK